MPYTNKKIKHVMSLWFWSGEVPHGNDRLPRHNFRGEERDKARTEKPLAYKKTQRGWRARADLVEQEEKSERERDGKRRKWQGVTLLKPQPDSMIYIEAFVKMPYRPEQEANYKSHMHTYCICALRHTCKHALVRTHSRTRGKNDQ